jgi:hypothetical protein
MVFEYEDPHVIEAKIAGLIEVQHSLTAQYRDAVSITAANKVTFKAAFSNARLKYRDDNIGTKITEGMVEDAAVVATEDSYRTFLIAEAKENALKIAIQSARSELDGYRSLYASHRELGGSS